MPNPQSPIPNLKSQISRRGFGVGLVAVAMLLAAVLASAGLGNHLFWDDEANTAIYAQNLLAFGRLTAWDGTNLVGYAYGGALGENLGQELRVPALPAYVAAAGFYLFNGTTFRELTLSGRIPFVVTGVLSIGLLAIWLRRHFGRRFPWYLPPLLLTLSPAYLLYIRNCRYYALGVMFTLLVWVFWAPGLSRGRLPYGSPRKLAVWLFRCLGAVLAVVLLIFTHYLNAASVLVTLPLFFLDRRYRQPRQYVLLGVVYAAAMVCGVWIGATANPFTADYQPGGDALDRWERFSTNAWWFVRDLGTHEFIPWVLVAVFLLPWLPGHPHCGGGYARMPYRPTAMGPNRRLVGLRRMRPLAARAWILVAIVLVYAVLAAFFTPPDMGKGPTAEMRYVVPLLAVGSVLGGLALLILWRLYRPLAVAACLLLVTTNALHLGFLANRSDGTSAWWPPTLYRYVHEAFHGYETGNEELIGLLAELPAGTTVRVWPTVMIYPAMFYVPQLHYCDQLSSGKKIDPRLEPLPDYLYRERARPDVIFVAPHLLLPAIDELRLQPGAEAYIVTKVLAHHLAFMSKPEIPNHFFSHPAGLWQHYPGMIVLLNSKSPVANHPALNTDMSDAEAICRLGLAEVELKDFQAAIARMRQAVRVDPDCRDAHFHLGALLTGEGKTEEEAARFTREAVQHFEAAVRLDPSFAEAHLRLGMAQQVLGDLDRAHFHFQKALELRPDWPAVHFNLGKVLLDERAREEAVAEFRQALKLSPHYASAHVELGIVLFLQGDVEKAISHYRQALESEPNHVEAHANLGIALRARARTLQAEGEALEARHLTAEAVAELGEALKRVPPKHALAAEIRQMLYEESQAALEETPPDRSRAARIREMLEKSAKP